MHNKILIYKFIEFFLFTAIKSLITTRKKANETKTISFHGNQNLNFNIFPFEKVSCSALSFDTCDINKTKHV